MKMVYEEQTKDMSHELTIENIVELYINKKINLKKDRLKSEEINKLEFELRGIVSLLRGKNEDLRNKGYNIIQSYLNNAINKKNIEFVRLYYEILEDYSADILNK